MNLFWHLRINQQTTWDPWNRFEITGGTITLYLKNKHWWILKFMLMNWYFFIQWLFPLMIALFVSPFYYIPANRVLGYVGFTLYVKRNPQFGCISTQNMMCFPRYIKLGTLGDSLSQPVAVLLITFLVFFTTFSYPSWRTYLHLPISETLLMPSIFLIFFLAIEFRFQIFHCGCWQTYIQATQIMMLWGISLTLELRILTLYVKIDTVLKLAKLVFKLNTLHFDCKQYSQSGGVALGTKMAPSIAWVFVGYLEQKMFSEHIGPVLDFYKGYMYIHVHVFGVSSNEENLMSFISFVSYHPAINYTFNIKVKQWHQFPKLRDLSL